MAQSDYELAAHISGLNQRTEINSIFDSILTHNSGSNAPTVTKAFMMWVDTSNATYYYLKMRNHDNTAWVTLFIYTVSTKIITPFIINSPTTNVIPKINADGTLGDSNIINDANGNVGIGVTPSAWSSTWGKVLQLNRASIAGDVNYGTYLSSNWYYDGASEKYIQNGYASQYYTNQGFHQWKVSTSGAAGNTITWNTAMTLSPSSTLNIKGTQNRIEIGRDDSGNYSTFASYVQCFHTNSGNNTYIEALNIADTTPTFECIIGGAKKSAILANGTFQSATNVYGSTSDVKLKEHIVDTTPKLEKLMKVQVRNFNYIGHEDKQIGVIAQEIEQIFPGIVFETKDTKQVEVEKEDGTKAFQTVETGEVTKNVKYSVIYMMMLKGMQEQQAIINDLKARIEVLESK